MFDGPYKADHGDDEEKDAARRDPAHNRQAGDHSRHATFSPNKWSSVLAIVKDAARRDPAHNRQAGDHSRHATFPANKWSSVLAIASDRDPSDLQNVPGRVRSVRY